MPGEQVFAPGQRVEIRGAEWVVQRADTASSGGWSLQCLGLSELVRGREAQPDLDCPDDGTLKGVRKDKRQEKDKA